jgi:serine/threonine-protein kinase
VSGTTSGRAGHTDLSRLAGSDVGEGKYRLGRVLGAGNFGTVFAATEQLDGHAVRDVALKVFSPEASAGGGVEGMLADCTLPAKVLAGDAPVEVKRHFAQIYDFGYLATPLGRCAFVAMELIRGAQTLEDVMRRYAAAGLFPRPDMVLDYMRQFFTALDAAHTAGVLHRDIKGANVMVDQGVLRVMDFGMGAFTSQPGAALKTTMSIFSPENFDGRHSAASDVYQAGLMFYQFYTGVEPFAQRGGEHDSPMERLRRVNFEPRAGRSIPGVRHSEFIDAVLARCLAYTEAARFGSARAVLEAIDRADPTAALDQALAAGQWALVRDLATQALDNPDTEPRRRIAALAALARAHSQAGESTEALARGREAVALAETSGALFHEPSKFNALVDAVVSNYTERGQAGMARLFAKKRK